jgi:transmembrane sensor
MNNDKIWHLVARKLAGEATPEELKELELLILEDEGAYYELQSIGHLWNQDGTYDHDYLEATYLLHRERLEKNTAATKAALQSNTNDIILQEPSMKRNGRSAKILAGSLVLVLVIASGIIFFPVNSTKSKPSVAVVEAIPTAHEIITPKGSSVTQFRLPDGSVVRMNAGSKLNFEKIHVSEGIREVYLSGEAFFDVVKNPDRPFIIHTSAIDVKVLGTSFNVKAYPEDKTTETSLISGSVEVFLKKRGNERHLLKPNEKLVVLNYNIVEEKIQDNTVAVKQQNEPLVAIKKLTYKNGETVAVEAAWTEQKLSFEDKPFIELALEMERWYNVKIIFMSNKAAQFHFSATFKEETIAQALEALKFSQDFKYNIVKDSVLIE